MPDCLQPHGLYTGVGSLSLLQGIFPTQGSNPGLQRCRRILYQLSYKGSPSILEWVAYPLLQRIFPTQELNPGLQHCRWILSQLSYQGQLPLSTGFSPVVTKSDHKAAAFFHAQLFSSFGNIIFIFYWSSVDFRCVCFRWTGTWLSYTSMCIFFFRFSSHIYYESVFSRLPWSNSRIISGVYLLIPNLLMSPFSSPPPFFPLIIISWFSESVSLFVNEFFGMNL